ncbi:MATE family efflux transporter [Phaeovulum vinaykumarii]|uniref:Multidrug resistance protein, MATE family n=1 Tax=Phaeovulum vinaykumarii TaxID=407234 RepID=A0A1N7JYU2_9RHOB|nr:MATE family efflux transporter [Phaeovulum vinaykumarii]SIS54497.1 multidrug resistance protein, MATE family [Phaeovulum vinaykumarii]SOB91961.1 MATE family multidrug resistance protein [Phaeovulum vinaykumarii]
MTEPAGAAAARGHDLRGPGHGRILGIALPIVASNATVPILGAVDTAVVGQMGAAAPIGAVGLGAVILATLYWVFGFLRMGTTGLVAQARGAGDAAELGAGLARALLIAAAAGLCLIAARGALFDAAFALAPASAEVETLARAYLGLRIWGAPATIALYALTGWLIALERTRAVLVLQLAMNGANAGLDLLFVLGLGWGVTGVAAATLIAEIGGLALALWLARDAFAAPGWAAGGRLFARAAWGRLLRVNVDIMIRSVLLQLSFTTFLFLGAGQGDLRLAANQVLLQFLEITAYALDGFAFAAEALVGAGVGARDRGFVVRAGLRAGLWGLGGAAVLALAFGLGGGALIDVMTPAPEIRAEARDYLPWLVAAPLIGIGAWMLDGVFIGATWSREMRQAMLQSVLIYVAALAVLVPVFGNHGLWAALMVLNGARTVVMARAGARLLPTIGPGAPFRPPSRGP